MTLLKSREYVSRNPAHSFFLYFYLQRRMTIWVNHRMAMQSLPAYLLYICLEEKKKIKNL